MSDKVSSKGCSWHGCFGQGDVWLNRVHGMYNGMSVSAKVAVSSTWGLVAITEADWVFEHIFCELTILTLMTKSGPSVEDRKPFNMDGIEYSYEQHEILHPLFGATRDIMRSHFTATTPTLRSRSD